ncbi:MAG: hypothetical protein M0Z66_03595 [Thermaerobacter sp.]|nr:hypothetical protein [Thermaerobacter sp.]
MSFFDALFGRTRLKAPKFDALFRLSVALPDLEAKAVPLEGKGGVCCRPSEEQAFGDAFTQAQEVAQLYAQEHGLTLEAPVDSEGYRWIVLSGGAPDDVITGLHAAADTLEGQGYGGALLAALFRLQDRGGVTYLVYNYKRAKFYPFRPAPGKDREEAREIQLQAMLSGILPIEPDLERWYPIWESPL